ncbi:Pentatricopeptide repeat-containing protein, mitochondrial [Heracleum sosnowskyi]|uniref:Pentatricopeptide repeat-containing protein, mitochondrial n=1 Tax=Heracleum sosnowskyi TaxID=360622 RepID=A0AAD8NAX7_9APIA|nr:Pentatricopeptide repeat-containing protein, mitochondrial [Heracleum sosnowskyi]
MFDHSMRVYEQMGELGAPRSVVSFNALLSACNHSKLFDKVCQLFDEMPQRHGFLPDKVSYGLLVKAYCDDGKPELGVEKLKEMEEKGIEVTVITFTMILHALYKKGSVDEAERLWSEMTGKGFVPDAGAYNVRVMNAQNGKAEDVVKMIEEMKEGGVKPDSISYNYLISCYCRNGMMDEAKKVYEGLEGNGCKPNGATFGTMIHYGSLFCRDFGKSKQWP